MKIRPIVQFKSNEEFQEIAKYLQHILFLDDWFVRYELSDTPIKIDDSDAMGTCSYDYSNREAVIRVQNCENDKSNILVTRNTALLDLIHEILHLKEEYISLSDSFPHIKDGESDSDKIHKHMQLEQMAKTLFMSLTGVDKSFFEK